MTQLDLFAVDDAVGRARRVICQPCRVGDHVDHHLGVWKLGNVELLAAEPDGTVCSCERCGGLEAARRFHRGLDAR